MTLKPKWERAAGEQVEMAENDGASVLVIEEFAQEDVQRCTQREERKVPDVLCKDEDCECERQGKMGKVRLLGQRIAGRNVR